MQIDSFFTNGFVHDKLDFDAVDMFKDYQFVDCNADDAGDFVIDPSAQRRLDAIQVHFARILIHPVFQVYTFGRNGMWYGVDSGSAKWHNDFVDGDPFTSNILVYLEDGAPYDNSIEIKTPFEEFKIVPKPNEFVWLNQNRRFLHRATHNNGPRRLLSFEYYIPALI